jgi:hypothetical protein
MTFNPAAAITIDSISKHMGNPLANNFSVIELGNQRFTAQRLFNADSTKAFYENRGFKYHAIDVNTERDSIIMDLNYDIEEKYGYKEQFDLVTNIGTTEHIFNQFTCFKNVHNLCKVGGVMYHQLPFTPWINHGFFNYNPIFFNALAYANGYEIELFILCDREGMRIADIAEEELFKEKNPVVLENYLKQFGRNTFINVILKKTSDKEFQMPFQGKYLKDIEAQELKNEYIKV